MHKKALAKAKARAKEAAKAATTTTPSPANSGSKQESLYKIFDLSFEKHLDVQGASMGTDIHDHSLPAVIRTCAAAFKAGEENHCKLNLLVFKAGLQRSTARREQRVLQNAHEVRKIFCRACVLPAR